MSPDASDFPGGNPALPLGKHILPSLWFADFTYQRKNKKYDHSDISWYQDNLNSCGMGGSPKTNVYRVRLEQTITLVWI